MMRMPVVGFASITLTVSASQSFRAFSRFIVDGGVRQSTP